MSTSSTASASTKPGWVDFQPLPRLPDLRDAIKPYSFQDWTLAKCGPQPRFAIGAATGLGKTFMSYEAWKRFRLLPMYLGARAIVLTNKSACLQFQKEHAKFYTSDPRSLAVHDKMPKLGQRKYADTRAKAYERWSSTEDDSLDLLVMNYHLFRSDVESLLQAAERLREAGIQVVLIVDEATAFKNRETITHRAVSALAELCAKVVILTATLTKGKLEQIFGIFEAVGMSDVIAPTWEAFLERYCITAASRSAVVDRAKLEQIYYYVVQNRLDDGFFLGVRAFFRRFAIKVKNGMCHLGKQDLDGIRELCARHPSFLAQVPTHQAFYDRLGVVFEEKKAAADLIITGYRNLAEFIDKIAPYVVILTKQDAADFLPPFVPKIVPLEHTDEQRRLIRDIYSGEIRPAAYSGDLADEISAYEDSRAGAMPVERIVEQGHIRRALLDPRLVHKQRLDDLSPKAYAPKTEELLRFLADEASGERIVVYTPSKAHLKLLAATVREASGLDQWYADPLEIHGDVDALSRERNRVLFQESPEHRLIFLNDAGLESLNLQAASILIVLGLPRSGGDMIQLAGRLSRLGSVHKSLLLLYFLVEDSQDFDDYDVIMKQIQVVSLVMGEAEKGLLDHDRLRIIDGIDREVSQQAYRAASLARLVLARRGRRMRSYGVALPGEVAA